MKKKKIVLIAFLILCIIAFGVSYKMSYDFSKNLPQPKPKNQIVLPKL